jgi:hypothetical protein
MRLDVADERLARKDTRARRGSGARPFSPKLNRLRAYPTRKRERPSIIVALAVNS